MCEALTRLFGTVGLRAKAFKTPQEFLKTKRPDAPSCLVLDVRLPGLSGLDLQRELANMDQPIQIVFITAHGDIPMTVQALKAGAVVPDVDEAGEAAGGSPISCTQTGNAPSLPA
jgi:FixJ family two-component response regulator